MALYQRGGVWWCKFKHRGKPHYESTGVRVTEPESKRRARDEEIQIKARVVAESGPGGVGYAEEVCLGDLQQFDLKRIAHKDEHAKADIRYFWKHLFRHLGDKHRFVSTLTLADVNGYERARRADGAAGQTIARERQTLVRGCRLAVEQEMLDAMPFDPFLLRPIRRSPKHARRRGVLHTQERIDEVLMCMSVKAVDAGHRDMCRFVMLTGLRSSEFQRAADFYVSPTTWGAILYVESAKGGEAREVPLTHEALKIYDRWKHRFAIADLAHSLTRASATAGGARGVTLRDLRKFYITQIARRDVPAAQRLAGHTNIKTTSLYIESAQQQAVDAALAAFAPATPGVTVGVTAKTEAKETSELSSEFDRGNRRGLRDSNPRPSDSKSSNKRKIKDLA